MGRVWSVAGGVALCAADSSSSSSSIVDMSPTPGPLPDTAVLAEQDNS